jgi:hypothetical protein
MFKVMLLTVFILFGCSDWRDEKEAIEVDQVDQLVDVFEQKQAKAKELRDPETGWLTPDSCDGILWSSKYAITVGIDEVDIEAAEHPDEMGRFGRRPHPPCWSEELGDQGSPATWSRDMFKAGLAPWAWEHKRLDVLERHAEYGKDNNWYMGKPLADGRTLYTPQVIGFLYQIIYALGGENSINRMWPEWYNSGLDDFEAHLQVMGILVRGEIHEARGEADAVPALLGISGGMWERIEEHYNREPHNPLYAYMYNLYDSGDFTDTITLLLDHSEPFGTYVRCGEIERCKLAEWLYVAYKVLKRLGRV